MTMSDSEEENFCYFGKPLEPFDEDAFPRKKPISVEEQIATDAQGRRRFHGAFTGGFSAGFYNTVGSLEGWTPNEFKSSREDKAKNFMQKPQDFMDDEDISEYGIAPQTIKATKEFSTVKKRTRQVISDGPIPGQPVLETLLTSGNETVGYLLLKNIGIREKIEKMQEETNLSQTKVYGCQKPVEHKLPKSIEDKQYQIPVIYKEFLKNPKSNTFGLAYQGLDKSHINLFQSSSLSMKDKNNKKISITGQAFGVGAFEDEDEEIYVKDDMSKYDFELTKEKITNRKESGSGDLKFGMFKQSKVPLISKVLYQPPKIPHSFSGKHKVRKSRFEPLKEETETVDRREINPIIRAKYLGENTDKSFTESKPITEDSSRSNNEGTSSREDDQLKESFDVSSLLLSDRFVSSSQKEDISNILEPVQKYETDHGTKEMREAARMKMFGPLTRITNDWTPCALLCKRFNVPEPFLDRPEEKNKKKRTKNLIFEYQKHAEDMDSLKPGLSMQSTEEEIKIEQVSETMDAINTSIEAEEPAPVSTQVDEPSLEETEEIDNNPADITEKIDVAEKIDLFKAVFLSSSESEDEEESTKEEIDNNKKTEELKETVLSDQLLPKIKPIKEGILSNVSFHKFSKPTRESPNEKNQLNINSPEDMPTVNPEEPKEDTYGPKLPNNKIEVKITPDTNMVLGESDDEWVEKNETDKKKKVKHKKKHKKEKHKKHKYEKKRTKN